MAGAHGGNVWASWPTTRQRDVVGRAKVVNLYGYRHFLREPQGSERSRLVLGDSTEVDDQVSRLLNRLALMLHPTESEVLDENPDIPSGYTYLLQLMAHDCVNTPTPFWQVPEGRAEARNTRLARLRLDTLYGSGPFGCPHAYAPDDVADVTRTRLRLGPMKVYQGEMAPSPVLWRDIARVGGPGFEPTSCPPPLADPLICDPRNEDNAILAQMTALWHMVHNAMLVIGQPPLGGGSQEHAREPYFAWARAATTMIYRRILCGDLMKRLLHPAVFEHYRNIDGKGLLDWDTADIRPRMSVPLELSHAVLRFAHTMIRPHYRITGTIKREIGQALRQTSARGASAMPLASDWIIQWRHFFEIAGQPTNSSLRIRPRYRAAFMGDMFPGTLPQSSGLALQDLLSGAAARLWSVPALYKAISDKAGTLDPSWDPFAGSSLATATERQQALRAWFLKSSTGYLTFTEEELTRLSADPPLSFYVQFEASHTHGGNRLGPLGSVILAEAVFGDILADPLPGEQLASSLPDALAALAKSLKLQPKPKEVPEITEMSDLIHFVADVHGLNGANPPFL